MRLKQICDREILIELTNDRRRKILSLLQNTEPINYNNMQIFNTGRDEIVLEHVHLPKLERKKLIEWNRSNKQIKKGENYHKLIVDD